MGFWRKLFGSKDQSKSEEKYLYNIDGLYVEHTGKPCALLKNGKDQVCGIWLSKLDDSDLNDPFRAYLKMIVARFGEALWVEHFAAIEEGSFQILPNKFDETGGVFLIFTNPIVDQNTAISPIVSVKIVIGDLFLSKFSKSIIIPPTELIQSVENALVNDGFLKKNDLIKFIDEKGYGDPVIVENQPSCDEISEMGPKLFANHIYDKWCPSGKPA